jgi:hypothetical protein
LIRQVSREATVALPEPSALIVQNSGFSSTPNAGGPAGKNGGFITPAG